jgi:hypothetical protein
MPDLATMLSARSSNRAIDAWRRISEKATSVVFKTASGTSLPAQSVRLEYDSTASQSESAAGVGNKLKLIVFGVRGHPTVADTNIKKGYRFVREKREYEVMSVIVQTGEVQGIAETVN